MVEVREPGPALQAQDVTAFESKFKISIPPGYREFLLRYNGGRPTPDAVDIDGFAASPSDVQVFFGLGRVVDSSDLAWNIESLSERCPGHGTLPIATDSGGNPYCIKLTDPDRFPVVYCDLDSGAFDFYPVADGFTEFLDKIREWQE